MKATVFVLLAGVAVGAVAADVDERVDLGRIDWPSAVELSGVAASRAHPGIYWVHNDSGDTARFFAVDSKARVVGEYAMDGATAVDWEDIAVGPDKPGGRPMLFIGDIGDNLAARKSYTVYALEEPAVVGTPEHPVRTNVAMTAAFKYRYAEGPQNAETLLCDPVDGALYVVTKDKPHGALYRIPVTNGPAVGVAMRLGDVNCKTLTAGDISPSGKGILLRNYGHVFYWPRQPGQAVADALAAEPVELPYDKVGQEEAICWTPDESAYVTTSEGIRPHLYRHTFAIHFKF